MTKNIIDKIWDSHVVEKIDGFPDILYIDRMLMHEVTSAQAFDSIEELNIPIDSDSFKKFLIKQHNYLIYEWNLEISTFTANTPQTFHQNLQLTHFITRQTKLAASTAQARVYLNSLV